MSKKVHVVDDEPVIATTLAAILNRSGYDAKAYLTPLASLEGCLTAPPDILITDVSMPGMNGIELAIEMKTRHPECQILLFSGQASTSDQLKRARLDGHHFRMLNKPVHPRDLLAALSSTLV